MDSSFGENLIHSLLQCCKVNRILNEPLFRSHGITLSSPFIAFSCPRLPPQEVGEARWDVLTRFSAFPLYNSGIMTAIFGNISRFLCRQFNSCRLLGVNSSYQYSWSILSYVAVSTHKTSQTAVVGAGKVNVAVCFMVLSMDGKPWVMRVQRERRNGDGVCPSGEDTFVSAPIPENYGMRCISRSFL